MARNSIRIPRGRCKTILQRPQVISKSEKVRSVVPLRDEFYSFPKEIPYLFLINFYLLPGRVACCNTPKTVLSHSQRDFVPDQSIFSQGCLVHHKKKCCKTGAKSPEKGLWFLMRTQQKWQHPFSSSGFFAGFQIGKVRQFRNSA